MNVRIRKSTLAKNRIVVVIGGKKESIFWITFLKGKLPKVETVLWMDKTVKTVFKTSLKARINLKMSELKTAKTNAMFAWRIAKLAYKSDFVGILTTFDRVGNAHASTALDFYSWNTKAKRCQMDFGTKDKTITVKWWMPD